MADPSKTVDSPPEEQDAVESSIPAGLTLPSLGELGVDASASALPQSQDQFIQQYIGGRDAFLDREDSTRTDHAFRQSLNPLAKEACKIVSRIRAHEHKNLWVPGAASVHHVYPGMPFSLAKERMEESKLWQIVRRMPKGCLLHSHFDAMFDAAWLIEKSLQTPGIGFMADRALANDKDLEAARLNFRYVGVDSLKSYEDSSGPSIYSASYKPGDAVPAAKAALEFKPTSKYSSFSSWICRRNVIDPEEALSPHLDTWAVWEKFSQCFEIFNDLISYEPVFRAALQRLFRELMADGIQWAEFRYCFLHPFFRTGQTDPEKDFISMLIVFDQELGKFQDSEEGQNFWGARFIWTGIRNLNQDGIQSSMASCIQHKAMFPHLIAAYDLVGQEEKGKTLFELLPIIFWFRKACAAAEVNIPFVFHAGETLETGSDTTRNMYDAVLLGTRRIGHGFALYKHPMLLETVKSKNICIESCPLSNEVLRLTSSVMAHPLPALLARGVKCTISNDDPAILGGSNGQSRNGSSRDMWSILQGWEDLGLGGLGSLAEESIRFALFEVPDTVDESSKDWAESVKKGINGPGLRGDRIREWRKRWDDFVEWVLLEYAADWGGDDNEEAAKK